MPGRGSDAVGHARTLSGAVRRSGAPVDGYPLLAELLGQALEKASRARLSHLPSVRAFEERRRLFERQEGPRPIRFEGDRDERRGERSPVVRHRVSERDAFTVPDVEVTRLVADDA